MCQRVRSTGDRICPARWVSIREGVRVATTLDPPGIPVTDLHVDGARLMDGSAWAVGQRGQVRRLSAADDVRRLESDHPAWDHVVFVGPADATADDARAARRALEALVRDAGPALAHGGVDLGDGWRTTYADARTAAGVAVVLPDRRDALLAALRRVGVEGASTLGPRSRVLGGLLGPRATHPVGRALSEAAAAGRWDAVTLAVAASDLVGPERVEALLGLDAPVPLAPEPWSAIVAAEHLADVLAPYTEQRRGALLRSLWSDVAATAVAAAEVERRRSYLPRFHRDGRAEAIRAGRHAAEDADLIEAARPAPGVAPRPLDLFVLHPVTVVWRWLERTVGEVVRSTVLLRLAVADRDGRLSEAMLDAAPVLEYLAEGDDPFPEAVDVASASRAVRNLWSSLQVATRPGSRIGGVAGVAVNPVDPEPAFRHFLVAGLDLARAAIDDVTRVLHYANRNVFSWVTVEWPFLGLGYREVLPAPPDLVAGWGQRFILYNPVGNLLPQTPEDMLRDGARPEHVLDGVWLGELVAVMAELHALDHSEVSIDGVVVTYDFGSPAATERDDDPLRPGTASLPAAIGAVAQLVRLGATAPTRPRTWSELAHELYRSLDVESWLSGEFRVPRSFRDADGTQLPGTDLTIRVADNAHTLAVWGQFMGNCIATYAEDGRRGRCILIGLYAGDTLVHNLEVRRAAGRWQAFELFARFNEDSPQAVHSAAARWLNELSRAEVARLAAATQAPPRPPGGRRVPGRGPGRRPPRALVAAAEERLVTAAAAALADEVDARRGCDRLADALGAGGSAAAVGRAPNIALTEAILAVGGTAPGAAGIAALLAAVPLATAVHSLDARDRATITGLERLLAAAAPGARGVEVPRRLLRLDPVAEALALGRARNRCGRALLGVVGVGHPGLAGLAGAQRDLGCALILARRAQGGPVGGLADVQVMPDGTVEGYPPANLLADAPPWDAAWRAAAAISWERMPALRRRVERAIAAHHPFVLRVPADWLGRGGWPAWWRRVNR